MASYALSRAAEDDLARIAAYTVERFGVEQAIAYRDGLKAAFEFLAENPRAARLREELKPPLRAHRFQSHLIVYDIGADGSVLIVRVRHGRKTGWRATGADLLTDRDGRPRGSRLDPITIPRRFRRDRPLRAATEPRTGLSASGSGAVR